mgnify:CR=1 FL=1
MPFAAPMKPSPAMSSPMPPAIPTDPVPTLLLTRPDGASRRFATGVADLGLAVVIQVWVGLAPLKRLRGALAAVRSGDAQRLAGFAAVWLGLLVFSAGAYRRHRTRLRHANAA